MTAEQNDTVNTTEPTTSTNVAEQGAGPVKEQGEANASSNTTETSTTAEAPATREVATSASLAGAGGSSAASESSAGEPSAGESSAGESSAGEPSAAGESSEGVATRGEAGDGETADGETADGETSAGSEASPDGTKRKRRRRRRKKGGAEGAAEGGEGAAPAGGEETSAGAEGAPKKEPNLPFQRFFDGKDREARRHAFSVGEVVAGRVTRVEFGAAVIDLFGKATAFAQENEPREVPLPPAEPEPEEGAEVGTPEAAGEPSPSADPSESAHGTASADGLTGAEAPSTGAPAAEASADQSTEAVAALTSPAGETPAGAIETVSAGTVARAVEVDPIAVEAAEVAPSTESEAETAAQTGGREPAAEADPTLDGEESSDQASVSADASSGEDSEGGERSALSGEEAPAAESAPDEPPLTVGQVFRGRVAAVAESGHVAIHNRIVTRAEARAKLQEAREQHRRVFGLVFGYNRGGFDVLVEGVRAFCPVSGMTLEQISDADALLGRRLEFSVQQAKSGQQGIVVSRRSIIEKEQRKRAKELRKSLQPGQRLKGRVSHVRDFGVFVDLGGVEGLVHMSELSWDRGIRPSDAAKPGDEVEVQVLRVSEPQSRKDRDGRIALSMKALSPDPWEANLQEIEEGSARRGKITRTADFGAFVEIAPGVEGLLHISELGRDLKHANERVKEGDELTVVLERIDRKARRISLSKLSEQEAKLFEEGQLTSSGTPSKAGRPGTMLKVKVDRVEGAGLYVMIDGVIGKRGRGFIPNSEMATERGTDHRKKFPPGTEIDVKVIGVDRDGGLRLSRKAFFQDEERRAVQDYRKEAASKGFGTFGDILKKKLRR